jgi:hypothetical protein
MDKYIPLVLAIALTVGGYYIERSIFIGGQHWMTYSLGVFVILLWAVAMFVIAVTYKDLGGVQVISSSTQVVNLID